MVPADLYALHARLADHLSSGAAAAMIASLLTEQARLDEVVARSYLHPNGFRKLVVASSEDGSKMRVHHWPASEQHEPSNSHNHRWPFAAVIIAGCLRSTLLVETGDGEAVQKYTFESSPPGGEYVMSPDGEKGLVVSSVTALVPGSSYVLGAKQLHRVDAEPGTLSLVLSGAAERLHTDVFRSRDLPPQSRHLPLLPASQVRETLELVALELRTWTAERQLV